MDSTATAQRTLANLTECYLAPDQFHRQTIHHHSGARRMWAYLFADAVACALGQLKTTREERMAAQEWLRCTDYVPLQSAEWVAELLDLNLTAIRCVVFDPARRARIGKVRAREPVARQRGVAISEERLHEILALAAKR